jgi:hypothetical protein
VIDMIVTLVIGTMVSGAIVSVFLLLTRVQGTWEQQVQARAIGLTAEETLAEDIQTSAVVTRTADCQVGSCSSLRLQAVAFPSSQQPSTSCIEYRIQSGPDSGLPQLVRSVTDSGQTVSTSVVAHGVLSYHVAASGSMVTVSLLLASIGLGFQQPVPVTFTATQRLPIGGVQCP